MFVHTNYIFAIVYTLFVCLFAEYGTDKVQWQLPPPPIKASGDVIMTEATIIFSSMFP